MFYLIGLGLGDVKDVTLKGFETIKKCKRVYLEAYTSILSFGTSKENLEKFYERDDIILADREMIESNSDEILHGSDQIDVCLLVVGDPFGATTHSDFVLRAKQKNIPVEIIHNASIMNAVGCCGLQLYNFGETVSVVFWTDDWQPDSYFDKILSNLERGLHTLCLLDIKVKEQSIENLMKGKKIYEPPRYMTASEAAKQFLTISERRKHQNGSNCIITESTFCVGLARVGWTDQKIVYCDLKNMCDVNLGPPLHSLIIVGRVHPMEEEMLNMWKL